MSLGAMISSTPQMEINCLAHSCSYLQTLDPQDFVD